MLLLSLFRCSCICVCLLGATTKKEKEKREGSPVFSRLSVNPSVNLSVVVYVCLLVWSRDKERTAMIPKNPSYLGEDEDGFLHTEPEGFVVSGEAYEWQLELEDDPHHHHDKVKHQYGNIISHEFSKLYNGKSRKKLAATVTEVEEGDPAVVNTTAPGKVHAKVHSEEDKEEMKRVVEQVQREEAEIYKGTENVVEPNWFAALTTILSYAILMLFGYIRDFFARLTGSSRYINSFSGKRDVTMLKGWENFFTRRMYHRIQDCWNRPIHGRPMSSGLQVLDRVSDDGNCTLRRNGNSTQCVNLGSYNYLGFADDWDELCRDPVLSSLDYFNPSCCSPSAEAGYTTLHRSLEKLVARFVGKPDAIVFNTGYGTNIATIPALMGSGTLIFSDALNHTSIVNGSRTSPATIRVFRHNGKTLSRTNFCCFHVFTSFRYFFVQCTDMNNLEAMLKKAIVEGQPRTGLRWRKIVVLVEGVYSMEGEIVNLPEVIRICKKYKAYLYVDEAHSIGALGKHGRGVCEHWNVDPSNVDVLMGTFTKSFGGMGGYVAASSEFCSYLARQTSGSIYTHSIPPPVCQQIISSLRVVAGLDHPKIGSQKLEAVKLNGNYLRARLIQMGAAVLGDWDSPVIPVLVFHPSKVGAFSREMLNQGLAVVVVGFPATQLLLSRTRFCVSAGHKKEDLDYALELIDRSSDHLNFKYNAR